MLVALLCDLTAVVATVAYEIVVSRRNRGRRLRLAGWTHGEPLLLALVYAVLLAQLFIAAGRQAPIVAMAGVVVVGVASAGVRFAHNRGLPR